MNAIVKLPFPDETLKQMLRQNIVALGKPGSGKSSKLRLFIEYLLRAKGPGAILDPKGDWWGLKYSADGKGAGFPVIVFGGDHADIPLTEGAGAQVAEIVAAGHHFCVIDLGGWMPMARSRFFIDFASTLFRLPHMPLHLVIDECHNFAPQGKVPDPTAGKCLHWANRLASEGRSKGVTVLAASQRPQKVHKDFLTTCETLIACRVIHKLDRGAVKDWIDGAPDPELGKQVLNELATMPRAEAWIWSPEINYGPVRLLLPMFTTYDSFSPQAAVVAPKAPPPLGLEQIRMKFAAAVKEAETSDPKAMRAKIAELEKTNSQQAPQLQRLLQENTQLRAQIEELSQQPVPAPLDAKTMQDIQESIEQGSRALQQLHPVMLDALQGIREGIEKLRTVPIAKPSAAVRRTPAAPVLPATSKAAPPARQPEQRAPGESTVTGPGAKILKALAWWECVRNGPFTKVQVAFVAGYSHRTGNFSNVMSSLKVGGFIDYPGNGTVVLTAAGRAEAGQLDKPVTQSALQQMVLERLSGPQQKVMQVLWVTGEMSREAIGEATGYSTKTGNFSNLMSSLHVLELTEHPAKGMVRAASFFDQVR